MAWSARVSAVAQSLEQTMRGAVGDWIQSLHNARPQYEQTATASALTGVITDPRTLGMAYPTFVEPAQVQINAEMFVPPAPADKPVELVKGPNIVPLPAFDPLPETVEGPVLMKLGDHVSTDEILPAGEQGLPLRSNLPALSRFVFASLDATYYERALQHQRSGSLIVGGRNYGQGSSREHAALAPRYLGVRVVLVHSFARMHWQNLINFGVLPLTLTDPNDWHHIAQGDVLCLPQVRQALRPGQPLEVQNQTKHATYGATHTLTARQVAIILAGGLLNLLREQHTGSSRAGA